MLRKCTKKKKGINHQMDVEKFAPSTNIVRTRIVIKGEKNGGGKEGEPGWKRVGLLRFLRDPTEWVYSSAVQDDSNSRPVLYGVPSFSPAKPLLPFSSQEMGRV